MQTILSLGNALNQGTARGDLKVRFVLIILKSLYIFSDRRITVFLSILGFFMITKLFEVSTLWMTYLSN